MENNGERAVDRRAKHKGACESTGTECRWQVKVNHERERSSELSHYELRLCPIRVRLVRAKTLDEF